MTSPTLFGTLWLEPKSPVSFGSKLKTAVPSSLNGNSPVPFCPSRKNSNLSARKEQNVRFGLRQTNTVASSPNKQGKKQNGAPMCSESGQKIHSMVLKLREIYIFSKNVQGDLSSRTIFAIKASPCHPYRDPWASRTTGSFSLKGLLYQSLRRKLNPFPAKEPSKLDRNKMLRSR